MPTKNQRIEKMKKHYIIQLLVLLLLVFLVSCSEDDNPTEPTDDGNEQVSNNSGQPIPAEAKDADGVLATISYEFQTAPGFPPIAIVMGFAQFGSGVDGGNVTVNGNTLGKTTESGTTFYVTPSRTNPTQSLTGVNFNGSDHSWQVSGNGDVPQLSGSVKSPSLFTLTAPTNNASITKSEGVEVTWTNPSADSNVLIVMAALDGSSQYFTSEVLDDDGSHTIAGSDLGNVSGDAMLQVVKYNYSSISSGGKDYYIIAEIVKSVVIKVN